MTPSTTWAIEPVMHDERSALPTRSTANRARIVGLSVALMLAGCGGNGGGGDGDGPVTVPPLERAMVVSYIPEARAAAIELLAAGGNAADAFVAAVAVECVVTPGASTLAGQLGALVHVSARGETQYLDADFESPRSMTAVWTPGQPAAAAVVVPGVVPGLESIAQRHGRLGLKRALAPAIALARDGFRIDAAYAWSIDRYQAVLARTAYGRSTFFRNDIPLREGERLVQPEVAALLEAVANGGAAAMYEGPWADAFAAATGGAADRLDLAAYRTAWREPHQAEFRGRRILCPSGRVFGGLWVALALKTIEHGDLAALGHLSTSSAALEVTTRVSRSVWEERWLTDPAALDDRAYVASRLTAEAALPIWNRVQGAMPATPSAAVGSHSYHVVVVDQEGLAITGTHSIQSTPWGEGLFAGGVPLSVGGKLPYHVQPGQRRLSPLAMHIVLEEGRLRIASGTFASSLIECEFQLLVNVLEHGMDADAAARAPRVGTFPLDLDTLTIDRGSNWLDPRVAPAVVAAVVARGLRFDSTGADTGLGGLVVVDPDGSVNGGIVPAPGYDGRAEPYPVLVGMVAPSISATR